MGGYTQRNASPNGTANGGCSNDSTLLCVGSLNDSCKNKDSSTCKGALNSGACDTSKPRPQNPSTDLC